MIRRIGAVPNHYRLGYRANGMSVWDVADEQVGRARAGRSARSTSSPTATGGRAIRRSGPTTCSPWSTAATRAEVEDQVDRDRRPARRRQPRPRRPLQHPHPQEDRAPARRIGESRNMFRLSQFMQELVEPTPLRRQRKPPGPVVIWNLIRRCNLNCNHCYSLSCDIDFPGELSTAEVFAVMDDLRGFRRAGADPVRRRAVAAPRHLRDLQARQGYGLLRRPVVQRHPDRRHRWPSRSAPSATTTSASASMASAPSMTASAARRAPSTLRCAACVFAASSGIKVGLRFTMTERQRRVRCTRCSI